MNWFGLVWFYGIAIFVGYLMPTPLYTYILNMNDLVWVGFYGISTIVGYCYVLGKGHKINKTNTYLERRNKLYIAENK